MLKLIFLPVALLLCCESAIAATFKCTDAGGRKITYANRPCEEMGLKSGIPVKSLVTVIPATPTVKKPDKVNDAGEYQSAKDETNEDRIPRSTAIKPVNPLVEKMLKW